MWFRMAYRAGLVQEVSSKLAEPNRLKSIHEIISFDLTESGRNPENEYIWDNVQEYLYPLSKEKRVEYAHAALARRKARATRKESIVKVEV